MKCEKCGAETFLPFQCPYCGGYFCSEHRLPENHGCTKIELARTSKEEIPKAAKSYEYTVSYSPFGQTTKGIRFSRKEIQDLVIAALLVIGVGLSMVWFSSFLTNTDSVDYVMLTLFIIMFTASFFMHEMAHKIVAQRNGFWAEFRLTLVGAVLTFVSIISPFFKIISPGAVMVAGYADKEKTGKISIAGPATNIVLSTVFLTITVFVPNEQIFALGAAFNAWIALFNLIPFGIFDGFKVFVWNKGVWALAFVLSLVLTVFSYQYF
jgi:Zn-dependent protease